MQVVEMVREGLRFDTLVNLEQTSGLAREKIARLTAIPMRTLTRRQAEGRLQPDESDRVVRASRIVDLAIGLFEGDAAAAGEWLQRPNRGLGRAIPLDLASTDVGAREVERLIGRIEHGIVA